MNDSDVIPALERVGSHIGAPGSEVTDDIALAAANRRRLMERLPEDEAVLLFGATLKVRNSDVEYRFRQDSDVQWLTGWPDPDVAVLIRPGADQPFMLFVQPRDPENETWTGRRPGPEGAVQRFGADAAFPIAELPSRLPDLLQGYRSLHYRIAQDADRDRMVVEAIARGRRKARRNGLDMPDAFIDPERLIHDLRLHKTPAELARMRIAARITAEAHLAAMRATAPGVHEYELEATIDAIFRRRGGSGPGYPTIVGGGDNATVLHYTANRDVLRDGDLVCVDAGCEYGGYTADVTRTWPVNGRFSPPQRALYEAVLRAQLAAIDAAGPGVCFNDLHEIATRVLTEEMVRLGLLEGGVDELVEDGAQKRYYVHGIGHWLGLDVHDVGAYARGGESRRLEPGMVFTVEPGLYIRADDEEAPEAFRGIGIRIEDDVLVTDDGVEVLTAEIPKRPDELEALIGSEAVCAGAVGRSG